MAKIFFRQIFTALPLLLIISCSDAKNSRECAQDLSYQTHANTFGVNAIKNAATYSMKLPLGKNNSFVEAKVDTGSSALIVNDEDYVQSYSSEDVSSLYIVSNDGFTGPASNARDQIDLACEPSIETYLSVAASESAVKNVMGLAFGDAERYPHEKMIAPFFDQLVKSEKVDNIFSLALCGSKGNSNILMGGIDRNAALTVRNFIPILERSLYVVPALNLRHAGTKYIISLFPNYDPATKKGVKTIIDSGSAFSLLPKDMAEKVRVQVQYQAQQLNLSDFFPQGFFDIDQNARTTLVRFANLNQIRQFPDFEISFSGVDGKNKVLSFSPMHYFKEMDTSDPLIRTFAIRATNNEAILGQSFIENHYLVFDRENMRIGFGNIDLACKN